MPFKSNESTVSIGEGHTPIVSLSTIGKYLGRNHVFGTLEYLNPTGSFKDRGSVLVVNIAKKENIRDFVEDSSGNAGASLSAYAALGKIKAHIFVPETAGKGKVDQISIFGSELHKISGPRENSTIEAKLFAKKNNIPYLSCLLYTSPSPRDQREAGVAG